MYHYYRLYTFINALQVHQTKQSQESEHTYLHHSEHPPSRGEKLSRHLGGNIGCTDKNTSWYFIGFLDDSSLGSTV